MFSLFRSVIRQQIHLNPARTIASASFSRTGAAFPQDQNQLADILDEEAKRHKPTPKSFSKSQTVFSREPYTLWKPFKETTHIRPHQLTYKSRLKTRQPPRKRQTLGPGSREARYNDVFHQLGLDPVEECQNADLLAGFMSEMGKIDGREKTGLTTKSQRRLGKAIRRAKHMGIIPILSRPITDGWRTRRSR